MEILMFEKIIFQALNEHLLSHSEIVRLLENNDCNNALFNAADEARKKHVGDEIHLRGLIEFSNICKNNCCYCGLRRDNHQIKRYRLSEDEIFRLAEYAVRRMGLKTIVLQSGEDLWFDTEKMCRIIKRIKSLDTALTLSVGEKSPEEYQAYRNAGADRFLLRIETTDVNLYERLDPGMSWENRFQCLANLRAAGFELGTGCLVGLPGQSFESLADDILFFQKINADMVGIGPFIPHPDTPLKSAAGGSFLMACKVMALTRLLLPNANIPATTAMEALEAGGQKKALQSGANVIMPNVTFNDVRKYYELYPGKPATNFAPDENLTEIKKMIKGIGRAWI